MRQDFGKDINNLVEHEIFKKIGQNENLSTEDAIAHNLWHLEKNLAENFSTTIDFFEDVDRIIDEKEDYKEGLKIAQHELETYSEQNEYLKTLLNQDQLA